jgi:RNA polymerase sigma-70 factor (ECF subfamily)
MSAWGDVVIKQGITPAEEDADQRLWREAAAGNLASFETLRSRHWDRVASVAGRLLRNPDDVADVAQETFLKAYQSLPRITCPTIVRAWLIRVTINACRERQRSLWRRDQAVTRIARQMPASEDPRAVAEAQLARTQIEAAVAALPEAYRLPLVLRAFEGLSGAEIASVLGCNESTVWTRIYTARRRLRKELLPHLDLIEDGEPR